MTESVENVNGVKNEGSKMGYVGNVEPYLT